MSRMRTSYRTELKVAVVRLAREDRMGVVRVVATLGGDRNPVFGWNSKASEAGAGGYAGAVHCR